MIEGVAIGLIIGVVMVGIGLIAAAMRKPPDTDERPRKVVSLKARRDPQITLQTIVRFAKQSGYKVHALDEQTGRVVLSDSASAMSWGFFYPVFVSDLGADTLVEIGIRSKFVQWGPIVSRSHKRCVNGIKSALLAAGGGG